MSKLTQKRENAKNYRSLGQIDADYIRKTYRNRNRLARYLLIAALLIGKLPLIPSCTSQALAKPHTEVQTEESYSIEEGWSEKSKVAALVVFVLFVCLLFTGRLDGCETVSEKTYDFLEIKVNSKKNG